MKERIKRIFTIQNILVSLVIAVSIVAFFTTMIIKYTNWGWVVLGDSLY